MAATSSNTCFLVGVFVLAALVTYNSLSILFGHAGSQALGQHMDSHLKTLNRREDAFSFEPRVVEAAAGVHRYATSDGTSTPSPPPPSPPPPKAKGNGKFHVLLTANDAQYVKWQSRVMYHYYKKIKAAHPDSAFGGFTRILHSGHPDDLMDEIPTVVVDTLPPGIPDQGYVVLHRPYAFKQWLVGTRRTCLTVNAAAASPVEPFGSVSFVPLPPEILPRRVVASVEARAERRTNE